MKKVLVGLATIGATAAVGVPVAMAADTIAHHPSDPSIARMTSNGFLSACDYDVDGHQVRAWYTPRYGGGEIYYTNWAPSGGCTPAARFLYGSGYNQFRICVEAEGCGPWVDSPY
jgi:hypothetical protein